MAGEWLTGTVREGALHEMSLNMAIVCVCACARLRNRRQACLQLSVRIVRRRLQRPLGDMEERGDNGTVAAGSAVAERFCFDARCDYAAARVWLSQTGHSALMSQTGHSTLTCGCTLSQAGHSALTCDCTLSQADHATI